MKSYCSTRIYEDRLSTSLRLKRLIWGMVYAFLFRPTPAWALDRWRVTILRLFGAKIGCGCRVAPSCQIWAPWNLTIGDRTAIAGDVDCYCVSPITLGSNVCISQRSYLCTASHDISSIKRPLKHKPINVQDHAWVCAEAFVGPGVSIGEGSVVAARALVTKDVAAWTVVGGNPAKAIKNRVVVEEL